MKTIGLFDYSGIFCRQWYARGSDDLNDARLTALAQIRAMAADFDHAAVCIDSPKSWRRDIYPEYKANRPPKEAVMIEQLRRCQEDLAADGFVLLGAEGFEADDVMATAAIALAGHRVTIISADKDLLACVNHDDGAGGSVDVLRPHTSPPTLVTEDSLFADTGMMAKQIPHWLALCGDTSDNVPGVERIGDKTARKLLAEHSSVKGIVAAALDPESKLTPKGRQAIVDADQRAECPLSMALKLVTLRTDAPIDVGPVLEPRRPKVEPMTEDDDMSDCDDCEDCDCPDPEPTQPSQRAPETIDAEPVSEPKPVTAMVVAPAEWERGLEPRSMGEAKQLAKHVLDSRMFSSYGTPQAALLVIMSGRELGIGAMASLRSFHVVEGKPTPSAQLLMGLCLKAAACETFEIIEDSREQAVVVTKRRDWKQSKTWTFDTEDAKDAGLLNKNNWKKYRRDMLLNRCVARAARFTCPEVVANLYDPEELEQS